MSTRITIINQHRPDNTIDDGLTSKDLKKELPPLKSGPEWKDEYDKDVEKGKEHDHRGNLVRDVVQCTMRGVFLLALHLFKVCFGQQ